MKLNVCVIDDDVSVTTQISNYIDNWAAKHVCVINTLIKNDLNKVTADTISSFDLIILDIVIGEKGGIEFAKELRSLGCNATIAFISNYNLYAINGYAVRAVSYILKPIKEESIVELLDYTAFGSDDFSARRLHMVQNGKDYFIQHDSILYIEALRHQVVFHLKDGEESFYYSIHALANQLARSTLIRCHRGFIINLKYVREISYSSIQMYGVNTPIPLGRAYINSVRSRLLWERHNLRDE